MKKLIVKEFRINRSKFDDIERLGAQIQMVSRRYFNPVNRFNSPVGVSFGECFIRDIVFARFNQFIEEEM